jgi:hypothetical protein
MVHTADQAQISGVRVAAAAAVCQARRRRPRRNSLVCQAASVACRTAPRKLSTSRTASDGSVVSFSVTLMTQPETNVPFDSRRSEPRQRARAPRLGEGRQAVGGARGVGHDVVAVLVVVRVDAAHVRRDVAALCGRRDEHLAAPPARCVTAACVLVCGAMWTTWAAAPLGASLALNIPRRDRVIRRPEQGKASYATTAAQASAPLLQCCASAAAHVHAWPGTALRGRAAPSWRPPAGACQRPGGPGTRPCPR